MSQRSATLHGNAPDKSRVSLLLIDVINDLEFPEGDQILPSALAMVRQIHTLKERARQAKIPAIYVNDNFGRWRSDFNAQVEHCLCDGVRGKPVVELLKPNKDDYFVLKPKLSGFYCTVLDILLDYLGVETVILTGIAGNNCVLFTAHDAYLQDFRLFVPRDCLASNTAAENQAALEQMEKVLKANTRPFQELDFEEILEPPSCD
jgi:nicotinamidase-related amidase